MLAGQLIWDTILGGFPTSVVSIKSLLCDGVTVVAPAATLPAPIGAPAPTLLAPVVAVAPMTAKGRCDAEAALVVVSAAASGAALFSAFVAVAAAAESVAAAASSFPPSSGLKRSAVMEGRFMEAPQ